MSERHPIIAITGSSGAGTTTVTRTFAGIFQREGVRSATIEGDSFHRYDRKQMKAKQAEAEAAGNTYFSHFGVDNNLLAELQGLFKSYSETGTGKHRRVRFADLMQYKEARERASEQAMAELAQQSQELGMGYE